MLTMLSRPAPVGSIGLDQGGAIRARVGPAMRRVDPVNLMPTVCELAEPGPSCAEEMQLIVQSIFEVALDSAVDVDDAVPGALHSRTSETFADIIFHLRMSFPQFEVANDKPMTFTRILLNVVQDEFEAMTLLAPETDEVDDETLKRQINLCSLIGNFFVRKLLAAKVMAQVVHDLVGVRDRQPAKNFVLCGCELLQVIGKVLDVSGQGNMLMTQFLARLSNLAGSQRLDTREPRYPQEVRNVVKSVHESRFRNWPVRPGSQILFMLMEFLETEDAAAMKQRLARLNQGALELEGEEDKEDAGEARPPTAGRAPRVDGETGAESVAADDGQLLNPMKVVVPTTGRECGVIDGADLAGLREAPVKEAISRLTGIHPNRIMVLLPDGETVLRDGR